MGKKPARNSGASGQDPVPPGAGATGSPSDGSHRFLFERSPVSLWEQDLSAVKSEIDALRANGGSDVAAYFRQHPDRAVEISRLARVIDVNQATLDLFGARSRAELLGNLDRLIDVQDHPLHRFTPNLLCLAAGEDRCSGEFGARTLQGKPLTLAFVWNVAEPGDTATYSRVYYSLLDITRRREAEQERARLADELRQAQKMEAIGALAGGLAHDFNNILTAVQGNAQLLRRLLADGSEQAQLADEVVAASERASALIQQLLSFGRRGRLQTVPVDVHAIVRTVQNLLAHSLPAGIRIDLALGAAAPCILGDPMQLETALLNLALNARDAMPEGGAITIATRDAPGRGEAPNGGNVEISVADTGTGMAPETRQHLFEPFFTTKRQGEGTGLGLASVHRFVRAHQGEIRVESEPGKGSTFTLVLPAAPPGTVAAPAPAAPARGPGQVLVVDDDEIVRSIASRALRTLGYEIALARDGAEAIRWFRAHRSTVDVILLDMVMPGISGAEAFRAIRSIDPRACIVLMSGYDRTPAADELLREGAAGFLSKPFDSSDLSRILRAALAAAPRSGPAPAAG